MRTFLSLPFFFLSVTFSVQGQNIPKRSINAIRVQEAPKVDGVLDDAVWQDVPVASDFTQVEPIENVPSAQRTEVKVIYTDEAIYIGAMLYDTDPNLILREVTKRDNSGNADVFGVFFDTYFDQQNMYRFEVTAAGTQIDDKENVDVFDAVWVNACKINAQGWVAELKIPYSAIRFPDKEIQKWGLQFRRNIRRTREDSYWQYVPNTTQVYPAFIGILEGIRDIKPPLRLSFTPYVGTNLQHFPARTPGVADWSRAYNAGLDLKYGINESFTLDATLAPDFGQVQSDNQVLNLSAFEVRFAENRPFFNEGVELFAIGDLFYARRIGKLPSGARDIEGRAAAGEFRIIENPQQTQLINATKVSGRTVGGLGLGAFNAVTAEMRAVVQDSSGQRRSIVTEPFTNYSILAANQTLPNNSSLSFINTNVTRSGIKNDANVTGLGFTVGNKENSYAIKTMAAISQKVYEKHTDDGYNYSISLAKIRGNFQYELARSVLSTGFDPNDLGLLFYANEIKNSLMMQYATYKPKGKILRTFSELNAYRSSTYNDRIFQTGEITFNEYVLLRSYFGMYTFIATRPVEGNDIYEARTDGRVYKTPAYYGSTTGISSDYRKKLALDMSYGYYRDYTRRGIFRQIKVEPRIRFSNKLFVQYSFNYALDFNNQGYGTTRGDTIYFSRRDVGTTVNTLQGSYVFSPNSSLSLKVRHYWSTVQVKYVELLAPNGKLIPDTTGLVPNLDRNVNFFNVDLVYTWRFAPGSDLVFVWKNAIAPQKGVTQADRRDIEAGLGKNVYRSLRDDQLNTFTLKVLYYLDYQYFTRKRAR